MSGLFDARYPGRCGANGCRIDEGDRIGFADGYARPLCEACWGEVEDGVLPKPPPPSHYEKGVGGFFGIDDDTADVDAKKLAAALIKQIPQPHRGRVFRAMGKQLYPDLYGRKA